MQNGGRSDGARLGDRALTRSDPSFYGLYLIPVAGLLGIQLGGTNQYFGEILEKPTIGDAKSPLEILDIRETITIMYGSEVVLMVFATLMAVLIYSF